MATDLLCLHLDSVVVHPCRTICPAWQWICCITILWAGKLSLWCSGLLTHLPHWDYLSCRAIDASLCMWFLSLAGSSQQYIIQTSPIHWRLFQTWFRVLKASTSNSYSKHFAHSLVSISDLIQIFEGIPRASILIIALRWCEVHSRSGWMGTDRRPVLLHMVEERHVPYVSTTRDRLGCIPLSSHSSRRHLYILTRQHSSPWVLIYRYNATHNTACNGMKVAWLWYCPY